MTRKWDRLAGVCVAFLLTCQVLEPCRAQTGTSAPTISPVGEIEIVGEGYSFTEGPAWDPKREWLLFTDIPNNAIHVVDKNGDVEPFTMESGHANGLMIVADGRLLACEMDGRLVAYDLMTGKRQILADKFDGKPFNAPNDIVMDESGGIYFTDPLFRAPTPLPQTIQAVYYRKKDGAVTRVSDHIAAPNGIALSPDGSKLYVAPSQQAEMLVFEVEGPGTLSAPTTFCRLTQPVGQQNKGGDGMTVDVDGNLYFTTHLGVEIFSPGGESIGLVKFPQQPANVTFAGTDRKTMVATARTAVYKVEMPIAGLAPN